MNLCVFHKLKLNYLRSYLQYSAGLKSHVSLRMHTHHHSNIYIKLYSLTSFVRDACAFLKGLAEGIKIIFFSPSIVPQDIPPLSQALFLKSKSLAVIWEAAKILALVSGSQNTVSSSGSSQSYLCFFFWGGGRVDSRAHFGRICFISDQFRALSRLWRVPRAKFI